MRMTIKRNESFGAIMRLIYIILMSGVFLCMQCHALNIVLSSEADDIVLNKKIWLRFNFGPQDYGIIKNSLQFSINNGNVALLSWHPLVAPVRVFSQAFKKNRRMFTDSFTGWLAFEGAPDVVRRKILLADANVCVSCLVENKDGHVVPYNVMLSLIKNTTEIPCAHHEKVMVALNDRTHNGSDLPIQPIITWASVTNLESDYEPIDKLSGSWQRLMDWFKAPVQWHLLWWLNVCAAFLFLILLLSRRYRLLRFVVPVGGLWAKELRNVCVFILVTSLCIWLYTRFHSAYMLYGLSGLCCGGMFYAFVTPPYDDVFLGRLKSLVGFILGVLVIPLALKAYLLQYGL
jgi:hypothetical protein